MENAQGRAEEVYNIDHAHARTQPRRMEEKTAKNWVEPLNRDHVIRNLVLVSMSASKPLAAAFRAFQKQCLY